MDGLSLVFLFDKILDVTIQCVALKALSRGRGLGEGNSKHSKMLYFDPLILAFSRKEKGLPFALNSYSLISQLGTHRLPLLGVVL
jgi:hypothetical protein